MVSLCSSHIISRLISLILLDYLHYKPKRNNNNCRSANSRRRWRRGRGRRRSQMICMTQRYTTDISSRCWIPCLLSPLLLLRQNIFKYFFLIVHSSSHFIPSFHEPSWCNGMEYAKDENVANMLHLLPSLYYIVTAIPSNSASFVENALWLSKYARRNWIKGLISSCPLHPASSPPLRMTRISCELCWLTDVHIQSIWWFRFLGGIPLAAGPQPPPRIRIKSTDCIHFIISSARAKGKAIAAYGWLDSVSLEFTKWLFARNDWMAGWLTGWMVVWLRWRIGYQPQSRGEEKNNKKETNKNTNPSRLQPHRHLHLCRAYNVVMHFKFWGSRIEQKRKKHNLCENSHLVKNRDCF